MQENNSTIFNFGLDETGKQNLKTISLWAAVYAIVSFIGLGITILKLVIIGVKYSFEAAGSAFGSEIISIAITLLINILLFNASSQLRKALDSVDQSLLTRGLSSLKSYFKVCGILLIIVLVFVFLGLLIVIMARGRTY